GLGAPVDGAPLVLPTGGQGLLVQLGQVSRFWHRDPVVAAEVAVLALHAALLVALGGIAELRLEAPVGAEGNEAGGLLPSVAPEDLLHGAGEVVVPESMEDTREVMEGELMGLEKCLLGGAEIGAVEGGTAGHAAQREHLEGDALAVQVGHGLIPIDL